MLSLMCSNTRGGGQRLDSEYVLKGEPVGFADSLDERGGVVCEGKRKVRKDFEDTWPYRGARQSCHLL